MIITQQDLINMGLAAESMVSDPKILEDLINEHDTRHMTEGVRYYMSENDILERKIYYYDKNGKKQVDQDHVNHRVPHGWQKLLVDQKTSYLLSKPVVISSDKEEFTKKINEYLDEEWDDVLQELGKNASNKGVQYLHPYVNSLGEFDYVMIDAEQGIPIYDSEYQKEMLAFIRYYPMQVNGHQRIRAEWWTGEDVTYYIQNENGVFVLDDTEEENPTGHFKYKDVPLGWTRPPFIAFKNNNEMVSDLKFYKKLIDLYDYLISEGGNDLTGIQRLIYVLRGYTGTGGEEFMSNIRKYKFISLDDDGGVETLKAEIPIEAFKEFLDRLEENLFLFGQGVNPKTDKFGNTAAGVALKFLYGLLELKANTMARKFSKAIKEFVWFFSYYLKITKQGDFNSEKVTITYSKSMLINDKETVEMAKESKGIISDKTIRSNHPWVENEEEELAQMEKEKADAIDLDAIIRRMNEMEEETGEGEDD